MRCPNQIRHEKDGQTASHALLQEMRIVAFERTNKSRPPFAVEIAFRSNRGWRYKVTAARCRHDARDFCWASGLRGRRGTHRPMVGLMLALWRGAGYKTRLPHFSLYELNSSCLSSSHRPPE
jgi:hypothetical protein